MKRRSVIAALLGVLSLLTASVLFSPTPASAAASLQEVTGFGTNPSNLRMFLYVPTTVTARPAIVVAVHYCHGDGPAFFAGSQFDELAEKYGYIVIYPSVTQASDGCFDVASAAALTHDGGSDPVGIVSMVKFVESRYNADPNRVYATGVSSGAMMTNVLLGDYPDVFKAGSAFAGVPFACFAGTNSWNSDCAGGLITKTAQQWGDLVRGAYPGYTGARPRMQVWHGTSDEVLNYHNFGEEIKQWTNVLGVSQTPTSTDVPQDGWTRTRYADSAGVVQVEAVSMQGVPHNLPVVADAAIHFFGLDTTTPTTAPTTTPTSVPTTTPTTAPTTPPTTVPTTTPATTTPTTAPSGQPCQVAYGVSAWSTGLTAAITITNTGTAAVNGWSLAFTLPTGQTITNGWNATYAPASGAVTATNVGYNTAIGPNASVSIGFQATHTGNATAPAAFRLNGTECSVS